MITLQDISGYLPYKLNVKLVKQNRNYKVNNIYLLSLQLLHDNYKNGNDKIYIPILRPLSDLTKEIEVNGDKFIPIVELAKIAYPKDNHYDLKDNFVEFGMDYSFHYFIEKNQLNFDCRKGFNGKRWDYNCYVPNQLQLFQKLFEWHFDVFCLIERGDAIDINTLK